MGAFLDIFQPFVVKFNNDTCLPKSIRDQYMLCVNAMGIEWFEENCIKLEYGCNTLLGGEDIGPKYLLLEDSGANKFDLPRIYVPITKELCLDDTILGNFLVKALSNSSIYGEGINGFRPSKDYYVNNTLYTYITRDTDHKGERKAPFAEEDDDICLPDFLVYVRESDTAKMSDFFEELTDNERKSKNIEFFYKKNEINKLTFSEYDFDFLPQTFFRLILQYTQIDGELRMSSPNNVYDAVQNYYANHKSDEATRLLQTIMQTPAKTASEMPNTYATGCSSCFNTSSGNKSSLDIADKSCYEKYKDAMAQWLSIMLSDIYYYTSWMSVTEADMKFPNYDLLDLLVTLLNEYISYGKFPSSSSTSNVGFGCPQLDESYSNDDVCSKNTIMNFIKVLEWTKRCELMKNKNKVKVYGKEFASFLNKF